MSRKSARRRRRGAGENRKLSHVGAGGRARMVDVTEKPVTVRQAKASVVVHLGKKLAARIRRAGAVAKGNVIETARIAGVLAAKRTAELIPMCHPLPLEGVEITATWRGGDLHLETSVRYAGKTGVEMEALCAAAVAALTVYDMCKSSDKGIVIDQLRLREKSGGKSGYWRGAECQGRMRHGTA